MGLEEERRKGEEKLRELGLSLYKAWKCIEHGECPEEVDPVEVEEAFWAVVDAVEALEGKNIIGELERRYLEERAGERKLPVPA